MWLEALWWLLKMYKNVDLKRHLAGTEIAGDRTSTLEEL